MQYFGYLSCLFFLFSCLLGSRVQHHCIIVRFLQTAPCLLWNICAFVFRFPFHRLPYISHLYLSPLFLNILIHVCLAYGKSRAEKCLTALSLHLQCFFPPVLYTLFLVFYSLTGWLFLFVFGCFVYILQPSVGRVLSSKNSKNEQLSIKQFVYLVYPVSQRGIFGCSLRDN